MTRVINVNFLIDSDHIQIGAITTYDVDHVYAYSLDFDMCLVEIHITYSLSGNYETSCLYCFTHVL